METVILKTILANNNSYTESGRILCSIAKRAIEANEIVIVDMKGIESVPTLLMNTSFGELIPLYGIEATKRAFRFNNIKKTQIEGISKYFRDSQTLIENI